MTQLSYYVSANGSTTEVSTYAEALRLKGKTPGAIMTTCYTPLPDPVEKLPLTEKQLAARVKAFK